MLKSKKVALMLVVTMLMTVFPFGLVVSAQGDLSYTDFNTAVERFITDMTAGMNPADVKIAFRHLESRLTSEGGLSALQTEISAMTADDPNAAFGTNMTNRFLNVLTARQMSSAQAAQVAGIFAMLDTDAWGDVFDLLDSPEIANLATDSQMAIPIANTMIDWSLLLDIVGGEIDSPSLNAYILTRALDGKPALKDSIAGIEMSALMLIEQHFFSAFSGISLNGIPYNVSSSFVNICQTWIDRLNLIEPKQDVKNFFADYNLLQNADATSIRLAPYLETMRAGDTSEPIDVAVNLFNNMGTIAELGVGSFQFTLNYSPQALELDKIIIDGKEIDSNSINFPNAIVLIDNDEAAGEMTMAVTTKDGGINESIVSAFEMVEAEFYAIEAAPGGFTDVYVDNLVFLDASGQEMTLPDAVYDAFYDIKVDADFAPFLTDVSLDGETVLNGDRVTLYKDSARVEALVDPYDASVAINGSSIQTGSLGQISREMTGLSEGDNTVTILAVNSYGRDSFEFTVSYNAGPEALVEAAENLTDEFVPEILQSEVTAAYQAYMEALDAVSQMQLSEEKNSLEMRLSLVDEEINSAEAYLFAEAELDVESVEALTSAFDTETTQDDIDAAQNAKNQALAKVDGLTTNDYSDDVDEAVKKAELVNRLGDAQSEIEAAQDDLYQRQADEAAAGVTSIDAPAKDATELTLPLVDGYTVTIKTSSVEETVLTDGTVIPPYVDTDLALVLTLVNDTTGKTADTSEITVVVPQSSKGQAVDAVNAADTDSMASVLETHERVLGIDLSGDFENLLDNADVLLAVENGQEYSTVEEIATVFDAALAERVEHEDSKDIITFEFEAFNPALENGVSGTVDAQGASVSVIVPYGTDVTNLIPTITLSPDSAVNPLSGHAVDFSEAVSYTVTAMNGTSKVFTVTLVEGDADSSANLSGLSVSAGQVDIDISPSFDAAVNSYSATLAYDLDAVTVNAIPDSPLSEVTIDGKSSGGEPVTIEGLSFGDNEIEILVIAQDGLTENLYTINLVRQSNSQAVMESFVFEANENSGIQEDIQASILGDSVALTVPHATDVSGLIPTISLSQGAEISPLSGISQDFTERVTYYVTAQDGQTTREYTVTVSEADNSEAAMLSFIFEAANNDGLDADAIGVISGNSVSVTLPHGTDISDLLPTIQVSEGAEIDPEAASRDFSGLVEYEVLSQDASTTSIYNVTVSVMPELIVSGVTDGSAVNHSLTLTGYLPGKTITISDGSRTQEGTGSAAMEFTAEGQYNVLVEASDGAGSESLSFTIDKTSPSVSISGVQDGQTYENPANGILPSFSFGGDYEETSILLDGKSFEEGSSIRREGSHVLSASATDRAGNTGSERVEFSIKWDMAKPQISISGVADGGIYESASPEITLSGGSNSANYSYEAVLNPGGPFTSGTEISGEGQYILELTAVNPSYVDVFSKALVFFEIDRSNPTVSIDIADGTSFSTSVVPGVTYADTVASQAYLREHATVSLQKDGILTPYKIGDPLTEDGSYTLRVKLIDRFGHESETAEATFEIDTESPVLSIRGAVDGATYREAVTLEIEASETAEISVQMGQAGGSENFSYQELSPPYTLSGTEGGTLTYHIIASAEDAAGNRGRSDVKFTIDKEPVNIVVSGVSNGGIYNTDRTIFSSAYDSNGDPVEGTTMTLDGNPFVGGSVSDPGTYIIAASNGTTRKIVRFTIDKTGPVFISTDTEKLVDDGYEVYNAGDILKVTATIAGAEGTDGPYFTVGDISGKVAMTLTNSGQGSETYTGRWTVPGGNYTDFPILIYARDLAGNTESAPLGNIDIDNAAPSVTRTVSPKSPDGMNGYYTGRGFSVLFQAGISEAISIEVNGANSLGGSASYTLNAALLDDEASNIIKYYARDGAGNISSTGSLRVLLDTIAPADPSLNPYDSMVNKANASLSGTVSGEGAKTGSRLLLLEGSEIIATGAIASDDSFIIEGIDLEQGQNSFEVIAEDIAGNRSDPVAVEIRLDMDPPFVAIEKTDAKHYLLEFDEAVETDDIMAIFNGVSASIAPAGLANAYIVTTGDPEEGANRLTVFAEDAAGNVGRGAYTWQYIPPAMDLFNIEIANGVYVDIPAGAFDRATMMKIQSTISQGNSEFSALMSPLDFIFGQNPAKPLVLKFFVGTGRSGIVIFHFDADTMTKPEILYAQDTFSNAFPGFTDFSAAIEDQPYYILDTGYLVIKTKNFSTYNPAVDAKAPTVSIISADFSINAADAAGGITLSGTLTDMDPAAYVESVKINGVEMDLSGEDTDKNFNISLSLAEGDNSLILTAKDTAGNTRKKTLQYSVDTIAPSIMVSAAKTLTNGETGTISIGTDEDVSITINGQAKGSIGALTEFELALENNQANIFTVEASDAHGNTDSATVTIIRDSTLPVLSVLGISDGDVIGRDKTITVSSTEGIPSVKMDGLAFSNGTTFSVAGKDGAHTMSAEAIDLAGNKGSLEIGFTVDTAVPSITITGAENGATYNNNRSLAISTDASRLDYTYTVRNSSGDVIKTVTLEDASLNPTILTDVGDGDYGDFTFQVTASKTVENIEKQATETIRFTVDRVYPVLVVSSPLDGSSTRQGFTEIEAEVNIKSNIYINDLLKIYGQEAGDFSISGLPLEVGANTFEIMAVSFTDNAKADLVTIALTRTLPAASSGGGGGSIASGLLESVQVGRTAQRAEFLNREVVMDFAAGTFDRAIDITVKAVEVENPVLYGKEGRPLQMFSSAFEFDAEGMKLGKPITVTFKCKDMEEGVNPQKLGVYRLNEETGTWEYVGGRYDPLNKTISVSRDHLSTYGVMLYDKAFSDTAGHWAESDIGLMASRHIANGMTEDEFAPDGTITRSQFATLLVRALGLELTDEGSVFADVAGPAWYRQYVMAANKAGLVNGMGEGKFAPDANISREQMAVMIMRAYNELMDTDYMNISTTAQLRFDDERSIASWASHAVLIANDLGIINGMTAETFAPGQNATRAQAIVMIKRLLEASGEL